MIEVKLLKATRPYRDVQGLGLLTYQIEVPLYVWTEILTHRRFARNASSARAMSTDRYVNMGYYTPKTFLKQGKGMMSSKEPIKHQWLAHIVWSMFSRLGNIGAKILERLGVAKEQRNRLIAPNKMIRAIVTGTEDGWKAFLGLRNHSTADSAMQMFAQKIQLSIDSLVVKKTTGYTGLDDIEIDRWDYCTTHSPFPHLSVESAVANIARVSYARESGKDDMKLYSQLLEDLHLSPFEHVAYWVDAPTPSCLTTKLADKRGFSGWETYRSSLGY